VATADELTSFVKDGLSRGLPRRDLEDALGAAGWKTVEIRSALERFADTALPIPVPRPRANLSARDAFVYLVLFSTLYIVAFNVGSVLFSFIDAWIPDPGFDPPAGYLARATRWNVSALIAAAPVFLFVSTLTGRDIRRDPMTRASKVRRWLTYLTLFVAAGLLIGDVTTLVYNVLGGELTLRFVSKAAVVAAIAGAVFLYYTADVRAAERDGVS